MSELLDKLIQAIGSNCPRDGFCEEKECHYKGKIYCKVEQAIARKCERIAIEFGANKKDTKNEKPY